MAESSLDPESKRGPYARSGTTRARILAAALAEAEAGGFQTTSVAKVAARANVAVGVLNYHFGSKQDLLRELMSAQVQSLVSQLSPPQAGDDFFSYEAKLLQTYLQFLQANPAYVRLAEEVRHHQPLLYREGIAAHIEQISARIEGAMARGELRALASEEVRAQAYLLLGAYTFMDRLIEDPEFPGDVATVATTIDLLRAGLAAKQ